VMDRDPRPLNEQGSRPPDGRCGMPLISERQRGVRCDGSASVGTVGPWTWKSPPGAQMRFPSPMVTLGGFGHALAPVTPAVQAAMTPVSNGKDRMRCACTSTPRLTCAEPINERPTSPSTAPHPMQQGRMSSGTGTRTLESTTSSAPKRCRGVTTEGAGSGTVSLGTGSAQGAKGLWAKAPAELSTSITTLCWRFAIMQLPAMGC